MRNNNPVVVVNRVDQLEGVFRLRRPVLNYTRAGKPFVRMILEDLNRSIPAYLWQPEEMKLPLELTCVYVRGKKRFRRDGVVADLNYLATGVKRPEDVLRLIPRSFCPLPTMMLRIGTAPESKPRPGTDKHNIPDTSNCHLEM